MSVESLSREAYGAAEGLSNSMLSWMSGEHFPAHFYARYIKRTVEDEDTPAKFIGRLIHRAVLEPDTMDGSFHVKPDGMSFATNEGKAWRADHHGKPIITEAQSKTASGCTEAVWRHPSARALLAGSRTETSVFYTDDKGTKLKGRVDAIPRGGNALADIKTVERIDGESIEREIWKYGWFRQAAFYLDLCKLAGIKRDVFAVIFIEKNPPYVVTVRPILDDAVKLGRILYRRDLALYRDCLEKNHWPGDPLDGLDVGVPHWAIKPFESIL